VYILFLAENSSVIRPVCVLIRVVVLQMVWKMHVVGSEQCCEGEFAYEACSDNV